MAGTMIDEVSPWQARRKLGEFKNKAVDVSGPWTGKLKIRMYMVSGASIYTIVCILLTWKW